MVKRSLKICNASKAATDDCQNREAGGGQCTKAALAD
jgi:hypothetical protein